jgi:hypothetical protein
VRGKLLPNGHKAWRSHSGITKALGPAGEGKMWHHIVEQTKSNVKRFGPEAIHNTENVIPIGTPIHKEISRIYSSKLDETGGMVVREWLRFQSYEQQRAFGLKILRRFGIIP